MLGSMSLVNRPLSNLSQLYGAIRSDLQSDDRYQEGLHVMLGVSGGVDSMLLMYIFHDLALDLGFKVSVGHIVHGTQVQYNSKAAELVIAKCQALSLPCFQYCLKSGKTWSEDSLRKKRREALMAIAAQEHAQYIVLGHHLDDHTETFLMRLFSGTKAKGLSSIRKWQDGLWYRPLLRVSKALIYREAETLNIPYLEDQSNQDNRFNRNLIRNQLIPLIQSSINPKLSEHILDLSQWMSDAHQVIESLAIERLTQAKQGEHKYDKRMFLEAPKVVTQEMLILGYRAQSDPHAALSSQHIKTLEKMLKSTTGPKKYELPESVSCVMDHRNVTFVKKFPSP